MTVWLDPEDVARLGEHKPTPAASAVPICGYPLPDHRLHCLEYTAHGWVCDIMRESDGMHFLGRSKLGPLEAWEEALSRPLNAKARGDV